MENGSGSGKLWKKTADLHIAMGEPEAFSDETGKLSSLRPHHFTDRLKPFRPEAGILVLLEHFHGWKKASALQETMLCQVPEAQ